MGGLITRKVLADDAALGSERGAHRHPGVASSRHRIAELDSLSGPSIEMMSLDSDPSSKRTTRSSQMSAPSAEVTTVATEQDLIVYPVSDLLPEGLATDHPEGPRASGATHRSRGPRRNRRGPGTDTPNP